ncbi:MAG: SDR family NAD(P)-dependent oxidoreductase [Deinococcota bacterium]
MTTSKTTPETRMVRPLEHKVALVTGAAKGIGQGIARQLALQGAAVVVADIDAETGQLATAELQELGAKASFIETDISLEEQIIAAVNHAKTHYGGLDILVNNAGINLSYDATTMISQEWDAAMSIDLKGAWLCAKYAIPEMRARGQGAIINIASVHATMTTYNVFPYAAAKAGLVGLTKSLALDWGKHNIRAVAVSPGWVLSDVVQKSFAEHKNGLQQEVVEASIPAKFIAVPDDIGHLVAFLASDNARYITGTEIVIDGGISARFAEQ